MLVRIALFLFHVDAHSLTSFGQTKNLDASQELLSFAGKLMGYSAIAEPLPFWVDYVM